FQKGAGWRLKGGQDPTWIHDTNSYYPLVEGPFDIEFKPVTNYSTPDPRHVDVVVNQTTEIEAKYVVALGALTVNLAPPEAVTNGARWRLVGETNYPSDVMRTLALLEGTYSVEFVPVPGFITPPKTNAQIVKNITTPLMVVYAYEPPRLSLSTNGLTVSGATGILVRVEYKTNLAQPNWQPWRTNRLSNGFVRIPNGITNPPPNRYYRGAVVP